MQGITTKQNRNGFFCIRLHYTAVPEYRSEEWQKKAKKGFLSNEQWEQEMEVNFTLAGTVKMYPMFKQETHVRKLTSVKELPLLIGWDYGYHRPAIVISQIDTFDTLNVLDEILGHNITIQNFTKRVKQYLFLKYPYHSKKKFIEHYGDPAGNQQNDKSEFTSIQIQRKMGVFVKWRRCPIKQGIRIIQYLMAEKEDGNITFKIDPKCKILIAGFEGGYTENIPSDEKASTELPFEDNYYAHLCDALRYLVVNKFPAHGILFKNNFLRTNVNTENPLSDSEEDIQSLVTGY